MAPTARAATSHKAARRQTREWRPAPSRAGVESRDDVRFGRVGGDGVVAGFMTHLLARFIVRYAPPPTFLRYGKEGSACAALSKIALAA